MRKGTSAGVTEVAPAFFICIQLGEGVSLRVNYFPGDILSQDIVTRDRNPEIVTYLKTNGRLTVKWIGMSYPFLVSCGLFL